MQGVLPVATSEEGKEVGSQEKKQFCIAPDGRVIPLEELADALAAYRDLMGN